MSNIDTQDKDFNIVSVIDKRLKKNYELLTFRFYYNYPEIHTKSYKIHYKKDEHWKADLVNQIAKIAENHKVKD